MNTIIRTIQKLSYFGKIVRIKEENTIILQINEKDNLRVEIPNVEIEQIVQNGINYNSVEAFNKRVSYE